jgi:hypothetical protein
MVRFDEDWDDLEEEEAEYDDYFNWVQPDIDDDSEDDE